MGSGQAIVEPLDPSRALPKMSYKDGFQNKYFSLESFEHGAAMLKNYSSRMSTSDLDIKS